MNTNTHTHIGAEKNDSLIDWRMNECENKDELETEMIHFGKRKGILLRSINYQNIPLLFINQWTQTKRGWRNGVCVTWWKRFPFGVLLSLLLLIVRQAVHCAAVAARLARLARLFISTIHTYIRTYSSPPQRRFHEKKFGFWHQFN